MSVTTTDGVVGCWRGTEAHTELGPVASALGKRALDVAGAVVVLVVVLPVLVAAALAVALSSPGPVLFGQVRVGRGGREFRILKFRTMRAGAEGELAASPELHAAYLAGGYKLAERADPRITGVGRILRRADLDELPQLWNVLRGDMSLVGPRPVPEAELARYGHHRPSYESVRPGMTGLWQVSGRNRLDYAQRVALDCRYAARPTVGRDLAILARTLPAVVRGGGGARERPPAALPTPSRRNPA